MGFWLPSSQSPMPFLTNLFTAHEDSQFYFYLLLLHAAGVVLCDGPKKSPRTSPIVQIIFSVWSFEISQGILRNFKFIIGFDSFANQRFLYLAFFLDNTSFCTLYRLSC